MTQTMPEPFTATGHKARVEADRFRVVCLECPWFMYMHDNTEEDMRQAGLRHKSATRLR